MTEELWLLAGAVVLGFVHIILQATGLNIQQGADFNVSARDEQKPPLTGIPGRLSRALRNFQETFPLFAAAILIAHVSNTHNALTVCGAHLYFWGRVVYVPLYAFGVPYVRSLVWSAASAGIVMILVGLI